jgi:hypothetical protein
MLLSLLLTTDSSAGWGLWDCHVSVCKPDIFEANIMHVLQPFNFQRLDNENGMESGRHSNYASNYRLQEPKMMRLRF